MRRVFISLAVISLLFSSASALAQQGDEPSANFGQEDTRSADESNLQLGVVGLINLSTFDYSADGSVSEIKEATEYNLGFGGGLRAIYDFTPNFGLQPEILYKQYGATLDEDVLGLFTLDGELTSNYLHVPLLARIALPLADSTMIPKIVAGPTFSYYLSGKGELEGHSSDIDGDDVNRFDIGLAAGLGLDADVGPGSVSFEARYDRSLTPFNKTDDDDEGDFKMHNTGFSFLAGYNHKF